ncbi:MAG: hypothetical protein NC078_06830 [Ruminococcus sp.]|nr:hypothetical protein [Ruminococcus sp.]
MKRNINNKISGKSLTGLTAAAFVLCLSGALSTEAAARSGNEVILQASGSEAVLEVYFPEAADGTASMQISLNIGSEGNVNAEFIPDGGIAAKITESRYQKDSGVLNIYLAGTESLFSEDGHLTLGSVRVASDGGQTQASVSVVSDSVKFVKNGELVSPSGDIAYPSAVSVTVSGEPYQSDSSSVSPSSPAAPSSPSSTSAPSSPAAPTGSWNNTWNFPDVWGGTANGGSGSTPTPAVTPSAADNGAEEISDDSYFLDLPDGSSPDYGNTPNITDTPDTAPVNGENYHNYNDDSAGTPESAPRPADTSALVNALARAGEYGSAGYTDSSYEALAAAVANGEKVLADPYALQTDIDNAVLSIENAIGMLTVKNDVPSGAAGYSESKGIVSGLASVTPVTPDENSGALIPTKENLSPAPQIADIGDTDDVPLPRTDKTAVSSVTAKTVSEKNTSGVWIAVTAAAALAAVIAVTVGLKLKTKGLGKNFKKWHL